MIETPFFARVPYLKGLLGYEAIRCGIYSPVIARARRIVSLTFLFEVSWSWGEIVLSTSVSYHVNENRLSVNIKVKGLVYFCF